MDMMPGQIYVWNPDHRASILRVRPKADWVPWHATITKGDMIVVIDVSPPVDHRDSMDIMCLSRYGIGWVRLTESRAEAIFQLIS